MENLLLKVYITIFIKLLIIVVSRASYNNSARSAAIIIIQPFFLLHWHITRILELAS